MQKQSENPQQVTPPDSTKRRKLWLIAGVIGLVVIGGGVAAVQYFSKAPGRNGEQQDAIQSHHTYSLKLMGGMAYQPNQSSEIMFDIRDETGKVLKNFDTVHEKQLHLIVVRKDRTYFQHVHPNFDKNSGMFAITGFKFPTDGEYRVFADFTPTSSQTGPDGIKLPVTAYQDVKVGNGQYIKQPLGDDKMTSDINGFSTTLSLLGDDTPNPQPYATLPLTLGVAFNKDGTAYKNLQPYLGALGHMVVLGPNLEYIHAHAMTEASADQTGLITFMVTFPDPGQYKIYLQTQANDQVNTTEYIYTVKPMPTSNEKSNNDSMQGME